MNGQDIANVPAIEVHKHPFGFNDICPCRALIPKLILIVVFLDIVDKYKLIIDFVILAGDKETSRKNYCYNFCRHTLDIPQALAASVQEKAIEKLHCNVSCLQSLTERLAHVKNSVDQLGPLF